MKLHLVDGTYELFRNFYAVPKRQTEEGREVGAAAGLLRSLCKLLRNPGVTHVGCAFDHEIESFRNRLFDGYKTGEGVDQRLLAQFGLAERAAEALGLVVWPGVEFEADDLIATGAKRWRDEVDQVVICSPDKDLAQCVQGRRVICRDRRRDIDLDEQGVKEKFGVAPASIPDLLALTGDPADGIPGIPRWGAKSASAILSRYGRIEEIPEDPGEWDVDVRAAKSLAERLNASRDEALLYKRLATLRTDAPLKEDLDDLKWQGAPREKLEAFLKELEANQVAGLVPRWRDEQPT